ncbi:tetratricopeptide repeat protein [Legionella sp. D16C41]|uniref:tetratricopeptide repeat protein n=1 Tax=Legionella sp. D16C41 TaxID=3402688 RepID=UPI003AF9F134
MQVVVRLALLAVLTIALVCCVNTTTSNFAQGINYFKVKEYRRAFIRLMPEAERGQSDAQYAVGYMYYYGEGVIENRQKALYWIEKAASKGQPDAVEAMKILTTTGTVEDF